MELTMSNGKSIKTTKYPCKICKGTGKKIKSSINEDCERCKGTGKYIYIQENKRCKLCEGKGQVYERDYSRGGKFGSGGYQMGFVWCWECQGTGRNDLRED